MKGLLTSTVLALQALWTVAAAPAPDPIDPIVLKAELIGNVTAPRVSRDGCVSAKVKNRALWTCGDTMVFDPEQRKLKFPLVVNTASWTDFDNDGKPKIVTNGPVGAGSTGKNPILLMYGRPNATDRKPFYPLTREDACTISAAGNCKDGSRTVVWQGGPAVAVLTNRKTVGYSWTANWHFSSGLNAIVKEPSYSLYRLEYADGTRDREALPVNTLVDGAFWDEGEIGYGNPGRVVRNGWAYLYGKMRYKWVSIAKVPLNSIEDKSKYQYFVNGKWTRKRPSMTDEGARLPGERGAITGGSYFYSPYFESFVWIGQRNMSLEANFYLSTAPKPEGPWKKPVLIYRGENGDSKFPSYGLHAHPALMNDRTENGMYLTWTQAWKGSSRPEGYITPLVYVTFKNNGK